VGLFLIKMPAVKKILEIFRKAFLNLKNIFCLRHLELFFDQRKKASLNSTAVRIRVKKLISAKDDMKIKKNSFSTLALELFFQSIANCMKLKIQKIQKSTSLIRSLPDKKIICRSPTLRC
jgi:hypothetical protein